MDAESSQRAHASDGNHVFENPRSSAIICAALHPNVRHSVSHQLLILEQMSLTKLAQIRAGLFVGKFALLVFSDCLLVCLCWVCLSSLFSAMVDCHPGDQSAQGPGLMS